MMGFLQAVHDLAQTQKLEEGAGDLDAYLVLPLSEEGKIIRIGLHTDSTEPPYKVDRVELLDVTDLLGSTDSAEVWKRRYLYRNPPSPSARWRFSPIQLLKGYQSLESYTKKWEKSVENVRERIFPDLENRGIFETGTTDQVVNYLESHLPEIHQYMEKKKGHALVFGIVRDGVFAYPGEIPAIVGAFRARVESMRGRSKEGSPCSLCHKPMEQSANLDKVFPFATFDKPGFCPGAKKAHIDRVFPICPTCLATLLTGKEIIQTRYTDTRTLPGVTVWIIPEVIGPVTQRNAVLKYFESYLEEKGASKEKRVIRHLAEQDSSILFHFVFSEQQQAKQMIHAIVEDVSPSWLRAIQTHWADLRKAFFPDKQSHDLDGVDSAFQLLYYTLSNLNPKNESDQTHLRDRAIGLTASILGREKVDTFTLKQTFVTRFPSLFARMESPGQIAYYLKMMHLFVEWIEHIQKEG